MKTKTCFIHALSPLHAGTGQAAELIDLPIARLQGSGIPFLPGSSIKGALRAAAQEAIQQKQNEMTNDELKAIYGPDTNSAHEHAGALVCMDARLLCLPVRSYRGTFAYVTSPLLLQLAARDLPSPHNLPITEVALNCVALPNSSLLRNEPDQKVYLEDLDLGIDAAAGDSAQKWAEYLKKMVQGDIFAKRFAIVADNVMTFLWETATQVDARIRIKQDTRTVADGALWLEESLPAETLLIGMLGAEWSRKRDFDLSPDDVLNKVLQEPRILQFGGKATVGRGRCRVLAA